jgi:hypothetical protein
MKIEVIRYNHDQESTSGLMAIDDEFVCFTLEDQQQDQKIKGETRIPSGTYKLGFREELSGLTKKYRARYNWFKWHLHVKDVPGFNYIYIHVGNSDKHTDGCLLVADRAYNDPKDYNAYQTQSAIAFERIYKQISEAIENGEPVHITYKSIWE